MAQLIFEKESDVTPKWLFYVESEASKVAQSGDEFTIQNYGDSEINNPELQSALDELSDEDLDLSPDDDDDEPLQLNLAETTQVATIPKKIRRRFIGFKKKIKKVFCQIINGMDKISNPKDIIKAVLLALLPVFAGGFWAAVLPIVVSLVAYLFKYGIEKTCPV